MPRRAREKLIQQKTEKNNYDGFFVERMVVTLPVVAAVATTTSRTFLHSFENASILLISSIISECTDSCFEMKFSLLHLLLGCSLREGD